MFEIEVQRAVFVHGNLDGLGSMGGPSDDPDRDRPPDVREAVAPFGTDDHGFPFAVLELNDGARKHWPVSPAVPYRPR